MRAYIICAIALASCSRVGGSPSLPQGSTNDAAPLRADAHANYKVIFRFDYKKNGAYPMQGLIAYKGTLYGTLYEGSAQGGGVFFSMTPAGVEKTLYKFGENQNPQYGPLVEVNGNFYGTTYQGGKYGAGTVFSISPSGKYKLLYSFKKHNDGMFPEAGLTYVKGTFYGTTDLGGDTQCETKQGCGTIFSMSPAGKEKVLYAFKGGSDGAYPEGGVTYANGMLWGTTNGGGTDYVGTIFRSSLSGKEDVVHSFAGGSKDGEYPNGNPTLVDKYLFGTTTAGGSGSDDGIRQDGGTTGGGIVWCLPTSGKILNEKIVIDFYSHNGLSPNFDTLADSIGLVPRRICDSGSDNALGLRTKRDRAVWLLYGMTQGGGSKGMGVVFQTTIDGKETVLHSFTGGNDDGAYPIGPGPIILNGKLYGAATHGGGPGDDGIVYEITP